MQLFHHYASELNELCQPVKPFPLSQARVAMTNTKLAADLGIDPNSLQSESALHALFSEQGAWQHHSVAQKYGGHQFGQWNPHLGDGRGLLLGEIRDPAGRLQDLHLKGAGPTPYSRHADGRAVLRSTIREYIGSEALHHLGIPSSRSLSLFSSQEPVWREVRERGAMMLRVSPSHIRFGHFEYFHHSNQSQALDNLFGFCFKHHFAHCEQAGKPHLAMLNEICTSTAKLIAKWQAYGFNHGVMNTDNMSIHGITFDYGPYAFLDDFVPDYICNHSDTSGRYAFNQQPSIGLWNLNALAHAFSAYVSVDDIKLALQNYEPAFIEHYQDLMRQRFGFDGIEGLSQDPSAKQSDWYAECDALILEFQQILVTQKADAHIPYRLLSEHLHSIKNNEFNKISDFFVDRAPMKVWLNKYRETLARIDEELNKQEPALAQNRQAAMLARNPKFVLRNHHLQAAIEAAQEDDFSLCEALMEVISAPFDEHPDLQHLARAPENAQKGIALSCSS